MNDLNGCLLEEMDRRNGNLTEVGPQNPGFGPIESDMLAKVIAETIGDLNVEIVFKPDSNESREPLKSLNPNVLKRRSSVNQGHNSRDATKSGGSFPLSFELFKILRKHSRKNVTNDSKTPIWDIKYQPHERGGDNHLVVTCGGNIINLIDLKTGSVYKRYEDINSLETFNCIVWQKFIVNTANGMTRNLSLLCMGGTTKHKKMTNISFVNADDMTDYFKLGTHSQSVNCLLFHPIKKNLLFSGSYDRKIMVWNLDSGKMTHLSRLSSLTVRKVMEIDCNNRILSSILAKNLNILVVSGEDGIVLIKPINDWSDRKGSAALTLKVDIPDKKKVVDGLVLVGSDTNLIAFRLKELIIVADLKKMVESADGKGVVPLIIVSRLRYCPQKCDYFYMTIESRLLCCGSADGQILLYYLKDSILKSHQKENLLEPIRVLPKPEVNQIGGKNQTFVKPLSDLLFVNIAAISPNHEYIVSGTNTNLVCIWKRKHWTSSTSHLSESSSHSTNKRLKTVAAI